MPDVAARVSAAVGRLRCTPAEAAALAMLATGALLALALLWFLARPHPGFPDAAAQPTDVATDAADGLAVSAGEVVVHVAGAVRSSGVYTLAGGSRVAEALDAAGGPKRNAVLDGLNLARVVTDGEQVLVPSRGDVASGTAGPAAGAAPGTTAAGPANVNLNQATPADLETLPNIGPVLATRIIQHRDSIGGFTDVAQLRDVPGIGEKTFQALVELVTI